MVKNSLHHSSLMIKMTEGMLTILILSTVLISNIPHGNLLNKLVGAIFASLVLIITFKRGLWLGREIILLFLFICYATVISLTATEPMLSLIRCGTLLQLAILFVFCSNVVVWAGRPRFFMMTFVVAVLASYLLGFTPFAGHISGLAEIGTKGGRTVGTIQQANQFGMVALQAAFFAAYLWITSNGTSEKMLLSLSFILLAGAVTQSGSRTAGLGFILLLAVIAWAFQSYRLIQYPRRSIAICVVCVMIVGGGLAVMKKNPVIYKRWSSGMLAVQSGDLKKEQGTSMAQRAELARRAINVWLEHPLGVGLDNFYVTSYSHGKSREILSISAHSNYLALLACTGLIGLAVFYGIYLVFFLKVRRISSEVFGSVAARRIMLSLPIILAFTDIQRESYYSKWLWLTLSLCVATVRLREMRNLSRA